MPIICNLYADWIVGIRDAMTIHGFDHSRLTDQECAIRWQSWQRRTVQPARRRIYRADSFNCPPQLQQGLSDFERAIESGSEIWPWQSKLIDRPTFEDGLYNDYRVIHFHLGIGNEANGYINRTGELLFALVGADAVYEIGVYHHGDWFELDILEIIDRNWPALLDNVTIRGLDVADFPRTREQVRTLRENHVVSIIKLPSGRLIAPPGGGIATDGTSIEAVTWADFWAKLLRNGTNLIVADIEQKIRNGTWPEREYHVRLRATDDEIVGVIDGHAWILWRRS